MRWKTPRKHVGMTRVVHRFLFFPKTFHEDTRWLEMAYWQQEWRGPGKGRSGWRDVQWRRSPEEENA